MTRLAPALLVLLLPAVAAAQQARVVVGTIGSTAAGVPTIQTPGGTLYVQDAPWKDYLLQRDGQKVEARVRGAAFGPATVEAVYRQVLARVQAGPVGGGPMLAENRSNVFQVNDAPWRGFLGNVLDQTVEARLELTNPGPFGGRARILRLWREVTGKVIVAADGGPVVISENRSNGYQVEDGDWKGWLMRRADSQVTVRLEVTSPGAFGGRAKVESAALGSVTGEAQKLAGGGGQISVNRSNLLQVTNAPWKAIVAAAEGRTITAEVRLVKPGMFGGEVTCAAILTKHEGSEPLQVVGRPTLGAQPTLGRIAPGRTVRIVGATSSHYKVALRAGVVGYVKKSDLTVGVSRGLVASLPGQ